ncbi:MAG TPA: ABC transporter substrate-binding protein [Rhizobacter sp.]|nr:ABC transporter substrate-binding protein [Rhizobacter sp.]
MKRRDLLLGGLAGSVVSGFPGIARAQPSVIKFGQSAALSGASAEKGRDIRAGIAAAFEAASKADGGRGPRFELITLDDAGSPERCTQNVNTLLGSNVTALIGLTSGTGAEAAMGAIDASQMPLLGTASGSMGLRSEKAVSAYHVRAGYDLEFKRMVAYVKERALLRVGLVSLKETSAANLAAMTGALTAAGIAPKETITIEQTPAAFQAASEQLMNANLDCVLFVANAAPVSAIIDQMNTAKYRGLFYASSMAGQDLIEALVARKQSAIMSVVVPRPTAIGLPVVSRCQQDLLAMGSDLKVSVTTLEGYISGRIAVEAARNAMKTTAVNKRSLKDALSTLRADLGGYTVQFAPGSTQGSKYVDLVALDRYGKLVG